MSECVAHRPLVPVDPPAKYAKWAAKSKPANGKISYSHLKSSAKYILSRFKTDDNTNNENVQLSNDLVATVDPTPKQTVQTTTTTNVSSVKPTNYASRNSYVYPSSNSNQKTIPKDDIVSDDKTEKGSSSLSITEPDTIFSDSVLISKNNFNSLSSINLGYRNEIYYKKDKHLSILSWLPPSNEPLLDLSNHKLYPLLKLSSTKNSTFIKFNNRSNNYHHLEFDENTIVEFKNETTATTSKLDNAYDYKPIIIDSDNYKVSFNSKTEKINVGNLGRLGKNKVFHVDVVNGEPVFDIKGTCLIYSINKKSCDYQVDKQSLTKVDLSSNKNLVNKLVKNLSNSALDSFFLVSETLKESIKKLNSETTTDNETLTEKYKKLLIELYNTINKNSSLIKFVDLTAINESPKFQISLPMGCSKISLSPYDLQFLTVSNRGDEIFLWDHTQGKKSIVLLDKYLRGKTCSTISQLGWGSGNSLIFALSKNTGSLHCFVNESLRNYEDFKTRRKSNTKHTINNNTIKSTYNLKDRHDNIYSSNHNAGNGCVSSKLWCLSCLKIQQFAIVAPFHADDFLIALTNDDGLLIIEIETGLITGYIDLNEISKFRNFNTIKNHDESCPTSELISTEIEVETCKPFIPIYNHRNIKFQKVDKISLTPSYFGNIDKFTTVTKEYKIAGALNNDGNYGEEVMEEPKPECTTTVMDAPSTGPIDAEDAIEHIGPTEPTEPTEPVGPIEAADPQDAL